jgi:hypothetical protein
MSCSLQTTVFSQRLTRAASDAGTGVMTPTKWGWTDRA